MLPGRVRIQWWRDVIDQIYETGAAPQGSQVAAGLAAAVCDHQLSRRWLDRVVEARERDLEGEQPTTVRDLNRYCDDTAVSMMLLGLECCGVRHATADVAASHAGQAVGMCTLLRGTAYHASRERLYIPQDVMARHGARARSIMSSPAEQREAGQVAAADDPARRAAAKAAVREMAEIAEHHLAVAADLWYVRWAASVAWPRPRLPSYHLPTTLCALRAGFS